MGNQNSTLQVSSTSAALSGLYAYVQPGQQDTPFFLTNNPSTRSVFSFMNSTTNSDYFIAVANGRYQTGLYNTVGPPQQPVRFYANISNANSNQARLGCRGDPSSKTIYCTSSVGGQPLNKFFTCDPGNNAQLQIGTSVPSGCTSLNLVYTPRTN